MISVLIPTYNSPDSLDLLLTSLIKGEYKDESNNPLNNYEIIVGVDGTIDKNKHIVDKWKEYTKITFLILDTNVGLPYNTNILVYKATQPLILILNDDNVAPRNWNKLLAECSPIKGEVFTPNQIEPFPSIFPQIHIENLGRDPKTFDLENFWNKSEKISTPKIDENGSTLPLYMNKSDYMRVGGWDTFYPTNGVVCDLDFFYKCSINNIRLLRIYNLHFYHFVSLTVNDNLNSNVSRMQTEHEGYTYSEFKWGKKFKRSNNNLVTL